MVEHHNNENNIMYHKYFILFCIFTQYKIPNLFHFIGNSPIKFFLIGNNSILRRMQLDWWKAKKVLYLESNMVL